MSIPLLYQLQNANYATLSEGDFQVAVVDPDDSALSAEQVSALQTTQDKLLYAYTSIGEAESYRDYWEDSWTTQPPDYVLGENVQWEGNFRVQFWDADWQQIIYDRVDAVLEKGYDGIYLDIVDGYTVDEVIAAYPGTDDELRQEMIDFVIGISEYAKAQNPDFAIIPQNAVGLLGLSENGPDSGANTAYLDAIDGLGVEDLWFNDNDISDWTQGDLDYISLAQAAGKFVLATSYPTVESSQEAFIADAIENGLIPFIGDRELTGVIDDVNLMIETAMAGGDFNAPWVDDATPPVEPVTPSDFVVDQFAVQYSNLDAAQIAASPYDLLIVEGKPGDGATADLSDSEVDDLVASGKTMVGYVSVGQSDDARPYWDTAWTDDGTDTGVPTDLAPSWLAEQADSFDAAIVEFWNPDWQALVIDQVTELATRGYSGIFLDNMLSYYEVAALRGELGTEQSQFYAQEMMKFVQAISAAGTAINPDFVVIPNGGPYIVGDAGLAPNSDEALAYYDAIDAIMAESFFGLATGYYDQAAIDAFQTTFATQGIDVLALEYSTDADAIAAFAEAAAEFGFSASISPDFALNTLPAPLEDAPDPMVLIGTSGSDGIYGGDGDDDLSGLQGADVLVGYAGDDVMSGGRGRDELFGDAGDDNLSGNAGADYLEGGVGNDLLIGGSGRDGLAGGEGNDDLRGGNGLDELFGGDGNDTLDGGRGHDYLEGGIGDDVLTGGRGNDELYGGEGSDQFVFSEASGWDVIGDFDLLIDTLLIQGLSLVESYETDSALVLEFDGNTQVEFIGLMASDLTEIEISYA
jgi:uncharacterized protein (TIGR01370 family)